MELCDKRRTSASQVIIEIWPAVLWTTLIPTGTAFETAILIFNVLKGKAISSSLWRVNHKNVRSFKREWFRTVSVRVEYDEVYLVEISPIFTAFYADENGVTDNVKRAKRSKIECFWACQHHINYWHVMNWLRCWMDITLLDSAVSPHLISIVSKKLAGNLATQCAKSLLYYQIEAMLHQISSQAWE